MGSQEVMQVCKGGHRITDVLKSYPESGRKRCKRCGAETISACLSCGTEIPGRPPILSSRVLAGNQGPPSHCENCGEPFPWSRPAHEDQFLSLAKSTFDLIASHSTVSFSSLLQSAAGRVDAAEARVLHEKLSALSDFFNAVRAVLIDGEHLRHASVQDATSPLSIVLRHLEGCALGLADLLGEGVQAPGTVAQYSQVKARYDEVVGGFERLLPAVKVTPLSYSRLPTFSDIPKRPAPPSGPRAYNLGSTFEVYLDLSQLIQSASREVFIVEPFPSEELLDLYLAKAASGPAVVRILYKKPMGNFEAVARKFLQGVAVKREVRRADFHDRVIFIDQRCWVIGHSMKDAARTAPTYLIEFTDASTLKNIYEPIWASATPLT